LRCLWTFCLVLAACSTRPDNVETANPFGDVSTATSQVPTLTSIPASSPTTIPMLEPEPEPTATATLPAAQVIAPAPVFSAPSPVVVISFDGASAGRVQDGMARGLLPTFQSLAQRGVSAESVLTITPSLTAAAHASLATGCYPAKTGIVGNIYHNSSDSFYWYRSGFEQPLDQVEPVWVSASRSGLKSATLFFAGGSPFLPGQTADYTISYGVRDAYSTLQELDLQPIQTPWEGEAPATYSPALEGQWVIAKAAQVFALALDSQDDGVTAYDMVLLNTQPATAGATTLHLGKWGALLVDPAQHAGAYFLLQAISAQGSSARVRLYQGGVYHNSASPRSLLEALNERFGFFPQGADAYALEHGWISEEEYLVMLQRAALWMADVTAWFYETYLPDLLFTWQDAFDASGHALQVGSGAFDQATRVADQALERILTAIPPEQANVLVVSDHGMAPVHTVINLNTILEEAGLLVLDEKDYVIVEKSRAIAFSSGGSAHIYINLAGRDKDGIVSEAEYPALVEALYSLLLSLQNPETGETVFASILRRSELGELHLDHPNSGDLFAQANPGFDLDSHRGRRQRFEATTYYGQHGYASAMLEMQAIFIAAGPGIPATGQVIPPIPIIDIAPTVSHLLRFQVDAAMDGNPISVVAP
jgi:predicted AlkP superfamily phosphohydrolase/phosphomutase